ncbi:uncharacterized protein BDZ83DRAFT_723281 [Colletotrichum acutatum]|uniref:Uncharacterized protein n=1 Tax=Glomerella acutata TaxID=27357 RepID=A0AAD8U9B7_GLOAC|nr:uncharacterized protein BDZ83DRAFT_723281 [Colletotrichum acutatum]KAK1714091.1 hypothetical protein BDZ83DRAFT_723281 [Colletotrichum acutatum]
MDHVYKVRAYAVWLVDGGAPTPWSWKFGSSDTRLAIAANPTTPRESLHGSNGSALVSPACIDPLYSKPVIDSETDEISPGPHHHVAGHFSNTSTRFNIYFPPKDAWGGRFFQLAYPTQSANATEETIGFGLDSKAYTVQVTGSNGFRAEAAAARYSRIVAARHYRLASTQHIYGYVYGGSGGSNQVIGGIENTVGVWDGAVAMVQAVPISAPNSPSIRAMAGLVLRNRKTEIQDSIKPGGSGDPLSIPSMTELERSMLIEATKLGVPIRAWEQYDEVADSSHLNILQNTIIQPSDPTYVEDFWSKPGYLGTADSALGIAMREAVVDFNATVEDVQLDNDGKLVSIRLDTVPEAVADVYGYDLGLLGADDFKLGTISGTLSTANYTMLFTDYTADANDATLTKFIAKGVKVHIDNKSSVAMHSYYRHQIPERAGFYGFDQFRTVNGTNCPQRTLDTSKSLARSVSGGNHTGTIGCKLIVVQNLLDSDAFPWHADWYRSQVKRQLGDRFEDNYRLWYNDNAEHFYEKRPPHRLTLIVAYNGIYQQALRDVAAWVEDGVPAPVTTSYAISADDNSVQVPPTATERRGIQPVVELLANGRCSCTVKAGQPVTLRATVETPSGTGKVVNVEWDLTSEGTFTAVGPAFTPNQTVTVEQTVVYNTTGNFITIARATSHRQGDQSAVYARVMNLARVNVIVV